MVYEKIKLTTRKSLPFPKNFTPIYRIALQMLPLKLHWFVVQEGQYSTLEKLQVQVLISLNT